MSQTGQADWKHRFPGTPECPENPECPGNTGCPGSPESSESPGSSWKSPKPDACGRHRVFSFAIPPAASYNNCGPRIPSIKTHNKYSQQILTARAHNKNSQLKLPVNYPPPVEAGVFFGDRIKTHNIKTARRAGTERQNLPWHLIFM